MSMWSPRKRHFRTWGGGVSGFWLESGTAEIELAELGHKPSMRCRRVILCKCDLHARARFSETTNPFRDFGLLSRLCQSKSSTTIEC